MTHDIEQVLASDGTYIYFSPPIIDFRTRP